MLSLLMLLACGPEVGLIGYRDKNPDTAETTDTTVLEPSGNHPLILGYPQARVSGYTYMHLRQLLVKLVLGKA